MRDTATRSRSMTPATMYAWVFGSVLTLIGVLGFMESTSQSEVGTLAGLDVNLFHNFVHLATGVLGIVAAAVAVALTRTYALVLGIVYTALGVVGLAMGPNFDILNLFRQINTTDSLLHLAIGVVGLGAYFATRTTDHDVVV